jgi:hypothetical protein
MCDPVGDTPEAFDGIALGVDSAAHNLVSGCQGRIVDLAHKLVKRHGVPAAHDAYGIANRLTSELDKEGAATFT